MKSMFTPKARKNNPVTSHEAAESVFRPSRTALAVFATLYGKKLTDNDLVESYMAKARAGVYAIASDQSIRSRRHELVEAGFVEWTGEYGVTPFGRRCMVWRTVKGITISDFKKMRGEK